MQQSEQHKAREEQAKDFECWNIDFNPPYLIPETSNKNEHPTRILVSDSKESSDDESVDLADSGPEFSVPEGVPDSTPEEAQNPDSGNRTPTPHPERLPTPN